MATSKTYGLCSLNSKLDLGINLIKFSTIQGLELHMIFYCLGKRQLRTIKALGAGGLSFRKLIDQEKLRCYKS